MDRKFGLKRSFQDTTEADTFDLPHQEGNEDGKKRIRSMSAVQEPKFEFEDSEEDDAMIANQLLSMGKPVSHSSSAAMTGDDVSNEADCEADHDMEPDNEHDHGDEEESEAALEETMQRGHDIGTTSFPLHMHRDRTPTTILIYEPRILRVFKAYQASVSPKAAFDCSGHMMVTCLTHMVDFCCWARSSEQTLQWIATEINENIDLRPRVRNGLTLLFVYAIAAAKAEIVGNTDMFTVMQDADVGLGIVSRTSLKIYNDYLNYFTFLKSCLSGLILAGLVPENERCNQPRRLKKSNDNGEEIQAFGVLQRMLTAFLNQGQIAVVKLKLRRVLALWHDGNKSSKVLRFSMAVKMLASDHAEEVPTPMTIRSDISSVSLTQPVKVEAVGPSIGISSQLITRTEDSNSSFKPVTSTSSPTIDSVGTLSVDSITLSSVHVAVPLPMVASESQQSHYSVPSFLFRFNRSSQRSWYITQTKIFDMATFLGSCRTSIYLVSYAALVSELEVGGQQTLMQACSAHGILNCNGWSLKDTQSNVAGSSIVSLERRLLAANAILASWNVQDYAQLVGLHAVSQDHEGSLLKAWLASNVPRLDRVPSGAGAGLHAMNVVESSVMQGNSTDCRFCGSPREVNVLSARDAAGHLPEYVLAVEVSVPLVLLLRESKSIGLLSDCWRYVYASDLTASTTNQSDPLPTHTLSLRASSASSSSASVNRVLAPSMADYLSDLFPQLRAVLHRMSQATGGKIGLSDIVIKYYPHDCGGQAAETFLAASNIRAQGSSFQTIGLLSDPASKILSSFVNSSRFSSLGGGSGGGGLQSLCHELCFEVV